MAHIHTNGVTIQAASPMFLSHDRAFISLLYAWTPSAALGEVNVLIYSFLRLYWEQGWASSGSQIKIWDQAALWFIRYQFGTFLPNCQSTTYWLSGLFCFSCHRRAPKVDWGGIKMSPECNVIPTAATRCRCETGEACLQNHITCPWQGNRSGLRRHLNVFWDNYQWTDTMIHKLFHKP